MHARPTALCALAALAFVGPTHAGSGWSNTFPPGNGLNGTVRALLAFDDGSPHRQAVEEFLSEYRGADGPTQLRLASEFERSFDYYIRSVRSMWPNSDPMGGYAKIRALAYKLRISGDKVQDFDELLEDLPQGLLHSEDAEKHFRFTREGLAGLLSASRNDAARDVILRMRTKALVAEGEENTALLLCRDVLEIGKLSPQDVPREGKGVDSPRLRAHRQGFDEFLRAYAAKDGDAQVTMMADLEATLAKNRVTNGFLTRYATPRAEIYVAVYLGEPIDGERVKKIRQLEQALPGMEESCASFRQTREGMKSIVEASKSARSRQAAEKIRNMAADDESEMDTGVFLLRDFLRLARPLCDKTPSSPK